MPKRKPSGVLIETATREMRIRRGDVLRGSEGQSVAVIEIRYVSDDAELVIARVLRRTWAGKPQSFDGRESSWTLRCRDWKRVGAKRAAALRRLATKDGAA